MRLTTQVLCIIFRERDGQREFLLLRRIPKKGGFWQPPSGGVEDTDDGLLGALYREVEEETGISQESILLVTPQVHRFSFDTHYLTGEPTTLITEHVFGVLVRPETQVTMEHNIVPEHDAFRWVSYVDALSLLKWENNKDGMRKLVAYRDASRT